MTRPLPYTEASLARRIKGVEKAGKYVVAVKSDGTLIVGDKPIDTSSLVPAEGQASLPSPTRRLGEYFDGGPGEA